MDIANFAVDILAIVTSLLSALWVIAGFNVATALLDLGPLVKDIGVVMGYTPSWLSGLSTALQGVSAFLSMAEGFAVVAWFISAALNPVLGVVKGAAKLAVSGVAMLIKGIKGYVSLVTTNQLDAMSPEQLHYQCLADAIQGCK